MEKVPPNTTASKGLVNLLGLGLTKEHAKVIPLLAVLLFIGILMMQAGPLFGVETNSAPSDRPPGTTLVSSPATSLEENELTQEERRLAKQLEENLALIAGAGKVRVMVTLEAGPTIDVIKNTNVDDSTSREKAADDSTRVVQSTTTRNDHVFYRDGTAERPVVAKTSRAEIAGVLVVAEGAKDIQVKARLLDATKGVLKIPANRIEVVPADGGR